MATIVAFNACTDLIDPINTDLSTGKSYNAPTVQSNTDVVYCGTVTTVDFMAGQHINAGTITVGNDEENLYVTYTTTDGWLLNATHLYIGENAPAKVAPGQFPYKATHDPRVTSYTYIIPLTDVPDCMTIAAHAEVVKIDANGNIIQGETAWGKGDRISPKGNWAMMFTYCEQECDPEGHTSGLDCFEYVNENTAWTYGIAYGGNDWSMYTPYEGIEQEVEIKVGRKLDFAGTAHFSAPVNGMVTITISLAEGTYNLGNDEYAYWWELNESKDETVKIQGYNIAPSGKVQPGQFKTYKGTDLVVTVPVSKFYGIHLDVHQKKQIPCDDI